MRALFPRQRDHDNTGVVIEHNLDAIEIADWVSDRGFLIAWPDETKTRDSDRELSRPSDKKGATHPARSAEQLAL